MNCECIKCGKLLGSVTETHYQPAFGVSFYATGQYGSALFDPMNGDTIEITVCDECLKDYCVLYHYADGNKEYRFVNDKAHL